MRRVTIPLVVVAGALSILLILSMPGTARAFVMMSFGGQPNQNQWNIQITYCTDGIQFVATQTSLASDDLVAGVPYSLRSPLPAPPSA